MVEAERCLGDLESAALEEEALEVVDFLEEARVAFLGEGEGTTAATCLGEAAVADLR